MNKFTTFTLAAAMVPALMLGATAVYADQHLDTETENGTDIETTEQDNDFDTEVDAQGQDDAVIPSMPQDAFMADDLTDAAVRTRMDDEEVGTVNRVIMNQQGEVVALVVSYGGVLGMGSRDVAIAWDRVEQTMEDGEVVLLVDMSQDELENAPEFNDGDEEGLLE